ncbi:MAG: hypothetical protein N3C61_03120 [Candidatus Micrarchaeota archaeon]|nr:hypothetical protein [Candidatus Micrarchaeota archaeon]
MIQSDKIITSTIKLLELLVFRGDIIKIPVILFFSIIFIFPLIFILGIFIVTFPPMVALIIPILLIAIGAIHLTVIKRALDQKASWIRIILSLFKDPARNGMIFSIIGLMFVLTTIISILIGSFQQIIGIIILIILSMKIIEIVVRYSNNNKLRESIRLSLSSGINLTVLLVAILMNLIFYFVNLSLAPMIQISPATLDPYSLGMAFISSILILSLEIIRIMWIALIIREVMMN